MREYKIREGVPSKIDKELSEYPEIVRGLLYHRGIKTMKDADEFLNPDYEEHTHDPLLLKGMDRAVERILKAISKDEKIVIYSDYDADGIPGGVILHDFFKKIGFENFENYIPHRNSEGFGLNVPAIEALAKNGANLIITVDCGIADVEPVRRAGELGVDVIITDHHLPNTHVPEAYEIINPNQKGCTYPNKHICGSGVAYKLVQALLSKLPTSDFKPQGPIPLGWEKWLLDMVGVATISDMVPLSGENRVFARYGLDVLRKSRRIGLRALLRKINLRQSEIVEDDVGFMISPRINAASRMDRPEDAFVALSTEDAEEAILLANHLDKTNNERKGVVASMVREIKKRIKDRDAISNVIVMGNPHWKPGLLGLAANAVVDGYKKPAFLWGAGDETILRGSCRSPGNVDLNLLMEEAKDAFSEYGGHRFSGGFSVLRGEVYALEERLNNAYENISKNELEDEIFLDASLAPLDITWELYESVQKISPFGIGNPKPSFLLSGIYASDVRYFGKHSNHIEVTFEKSDGSRIRAVKFFVGRNGENLSVEKGEKISIVGTLEKNSFGRVPELRIRIDDVIRQTK